MATALLQARTGSTRLPGKALLPIGGRPMLYYSVAALKLSPAVSRIVLAVPDLRGDDPLEALAAQWGIDCFRGDEEDVLARFAAAAAEFPDRWYFRATGDNPLLDPGNPGRTLSRLVEAGAEYACETDMPLGTVVEAFTAAALARCHREAKTARDREHVTLYMKESGTFACRFFPAPEPFRHPDWRLTVDTPEDYRRDRRLLEALAGEGYPDFATVIETLSRHPDWR
ncbi:MAG TPA: NTP transferase domain-containing protein [Candidatus Aminicenantes bacterium]|nr:NTP transferase domain-containing protein [Candidatus Aminicenantes bacterium]